jgi:hypothetical protein
MQSSGVLKYAREYREVSGPAAWIPALAGRRERDEFASLGAITLRVGSRFADTEQATRIRLADPQHHDTLSPAQRQDVSTAQCRHALLADCQDLRELLG